MLIIFRIRALFMIHSLASMTWVVVICVTEIEESFLIVNRDSAWKVQIDFTIYYGFIGKTNEYLCCSYKLEHLRSQLVTLSTNHISCHRAHNRRALYACMVYVDVAHCELHRFFFLLVSLEWPQSEFDCTRMWRAYKIYRNEYNRQNSSTDSKRKPFASHSHHALNLYVCLIRIKQVFHVSIAQCSKFYQ